MFSLNYAPRPLPYVVGGTEDRCELGAVPRTERFGGRREGDQSRHSVVRLLLLQVSEAKDPIYHLPENYRKNKASYRGTPSPYTVLARDTEEIEFLYRFFFFFRIALVRKLVPFFYLFFIFLPEVRYPGASNWLKSLFTARCIRRFSRLVVSKSVLFLLWDLVLITVRYCYWYCRVMACFFVY